MAYVACGSEFDLSMFFLWIGVLIWIVVYDTFYALVDIDDDLKTGVFSTAILFGDKVSFVTSLSQIIVLVVWAYLGIILEMSLLYFLMLIIVLLLFARQQLLISIGREKIALRHLMRVGTLVFFHFFGNFSKPLLTKKKRAQIKKIFLHLFLVYTIVFSRFFEDNAPS